MPTDSPLHIYEKAMLLILKDEEGIVGVSHCDLALAGAILSELFLDERLTVEGEKYLVRVKDASGTGDALLDECLELIERASTARPLQKCLTEIAALSELKHRIARGLCRRGILREDEGKVLLFFTRRIYPEVDPGPEDALVAELTEAIFTDTDEVSPHVAALIALGNGVGLLNGTFPRKDLRQRRERLEAIARGDVGTVSQAAAAAREAIEAAMLVCVIVPAIIT